MALPKLDVAIYELALPSTNKKISYRPFLVREEKILLMAMEGSDEGEITNSIKQVINNCIVSDGVNVDTLPLFDIEYILLNLRARSMGDVIKTNYTRPDCKEENCVPIEIEIDVNTIKVHKSPEHNAKIELSDKVGLVMKYPNIELMTKYAGKFEDESIDDAFDLIIKCIDTVYDEENVYSKTDYTAAELVEFVEGFSQDQFSQIEKFFNTLPKMYKDVEFDCKKCNHKEEIRLEGLASFFG
tara:strand:- start:675 stop:1400 length:726 start_codon:yes stop_codon:yes gene_type:complete